SELWLRTREKFFRPKALVDKFKECRPDGDSLLQQVHVVYVNPDEKLGRSVVEVVEQIIGRVSSVGVTWGRTISGLESALRSYMSGPWRQSNPVRFVPLCGEPLKERRPLKYS